MKNDPKQTSRWLISCLSGRLVCSLASGCCFLFHFSRCRSNKVMAFDLFIAAEPSLLQLLKIQPFCVAWIDLRAVSLVRRPRLREHKRFTGKWSDTRARAGKVAGEVLADKVSVHVLILILILNLILVPKGGRLVDRLVCRPDWSASRGRSKTCTESRRDRRLYCGCWQKWRIVTQANWITLEIIKEPLWAFSTLYWRT